MTATDPAPVSHRCEYGDPLTPHDAHHYVTYVRPMPDGSERLSEERHYICDPHFHEVDRALRKNAWKQFLRCVRPCANEVMS